MNTSEDTKVPYSSGVTQFQGTFFISSPKASRILTVSGIASLPIPIFNHISFMPMGLPYMFRRILHVSGNNWKRLSDNG
jgi:hypothetical protein